MTVPNTAVDVVVVVVGVAAIDVIDVDIVAVVVIGVSTLNRYFYSTKAVRPEITPE